MYLSRVPTFGLNIIYRVFRIRALLLMDSIFYTTVVDYQYTSRALQQ